MGPSRHQGQGERPVWAGHGGSADDLGTWILVISVSKAGDFYLNIGQDHDKPIEADLLVNRVAAVISNHPQTPVLVRGDRAVDYGRVTEAMVLLQSAGVEKVGLMTESQDQ